MGKDFFCFYQGFRNKKNFFIKKCKSRCFVFKNTNKKGNFYIFWFCSCFQNYFFSFFFSDPLGKKKGRTVRRFLKPFYQIRVLGPQEKKKRRKKIILRTCLWNRWLRPPFGASIQVLKLERKLSKKYERREFFFKTRRPVAFTCGKDSFKKNRDGCKLGKERGDFITYIWRNFDLLIRIRLFFKNTLIRSNTQKSLHIAFGNF